MYGYIKWSHISGNGWEIIEASLAAHWSFQGLRTNFVFYYVSWWFGTDKSASAMKSKISVSIHFDFGSIIVAFMNTDHNVSYHNQIYVPQRDIVGDGTPTHLQIGHPWI